MYLSAQNYPEKIIDSAIEEAKKIPQNILRTTRKKEKDPFLIPFVTTYNPKHFNIFQEAKKNFSIIERDQELQQLIKQSDLLHSQRQPPNLKKILTRAKFHSTPEKYVVSKCGDSRCGTCPYLKTGDSISFKCGQTLYVNENMSCKSKNLLYCITCNHCGEHYIGQPEHSLPPACASIASRLMIPVPETPHAVNILADVLREIMKYSHFINLKPIQPP